MRIYLFFLCVMFLVSCSERAKNEKAIEEAKQLIKKSGESVETVSEIPFGFRFGWTKEFTEKYVDSLKRKGLIIADSFPIFTYKYPQYKGLKADVELFFVDDCLARMAFKQIYKTEYIHELTKEYAELLRFLYISGSTKLQYKIPIDGVDDESNWDEVTLSVKDNFVAMYKIIRYSSFLQEEKVYVFSNQPKAKRLSDYMTRKEKEKGDKRIKEIVEKETLYKEYEEDIESNKYRIMAAVKLYLEDTLKDPDSYKSIEWGEITKYKNKYHVKHKYRAKNSFGGYVVEEYNFCVDSNWNVSILSDLY